MATLCPAAAENEFFHEYPNVFKAKQDFVTMRLNFIAFGLYNETDYLAKWGKAA